MTTLKFTSMVNSSVNITDAAIVNQDTDTDNGGKVVGFDTTCLTNWRAGETSVTADTALAFDGGFLYATFSTADGQTWQGNVTGGSGKFKGATGTVTATATSDSPHPWVYSALEVTVDYG